MRGRRFVEREPNPDEFRAPSRARYGPRLWAAAAASMIVGATLFTLFGSNPEVPPPAWLAIPALTVSLVVAAVRSRRLGVTVEPGRLVVRGMLSTERHAFDAIVGLSARPEYAAPRDERHPLVRHVPTLSLTSGDPVQLGCLAGSPDDVERLVAELRASLIRAGWTKALVWKIDSDRRNVP